MRVAMIGCGKLGAPCAEVMAEHYDVIGYDIHPVDTTIPMTDSIEQAVKNRDIIFIAVPTPHESLYDGSNPISNLEPKNFDYSIVCSVLSEVNLYANADQLVVLISTVLPGTVRKHFVPLLTNTRFIYNPYLIAMGSVKWDMVNPECLIIGTGDGTITGDANILVEFYKPLLENNAPTNIGTWEEAEAIKIFYNTWISTKLGLVNMIQDVAERLGNMNVDIVTDALKRATQRITGPKYMTAGMGDAGACVLPQFNIRVNNEIINIAALYDQFHSSIGREYYVDSCDHHCTVSENKRIITVTKREYRGPMLVFKTANGELTVTPNHLIPVYRDDILQLVRADEIRITDQLSDI